MQFTVITGKEFNEIFADKEFYKLTTEDENHNGFQFKTGLNIDTVEFNPYGTCNAGGIYFIEFKYILRWIEYGDKIMSKIRKVTIPDDAKIYIEYEKFKADKLSLVDPVNLDEFLSSDKITEKFFLDSVKDIAYTLKYIPDHLKTNEICLTAISHSGSLLEFVPDKLKTFEICLAAMKKFDSAIIFVPEDIRKNIFDAMKTRIHTKN